MNRIVFVQREVEDKLGPMTLVAYLKSKDFSADILIDPIKHIDNIRQINPEFIGISFLSPSVDWVLKTCRFLKAHIPKALIVLGGPHPTFFPDIIEQEGIDIVCIGEGEKSLLHLMQSYDGTVSSIEDTPNCWIKNGAKIKKNSVCSFLTEQELSEAPYSDRSHYSRYASLRNSPHKKIWTSRGCPYNCSYCFNYKYKEIYKGLGKVVRQRSVDSVINELKDLKRYGWQCLEIVDDQFLTSKDWLEEFCDKYQRFIKLPFTCNSTAIQIKHNVVSVLKKAGCKAIYFAIESGVEKTRNEIYNKPVTNQDIYNAADALHSNEMPFLTFNMIGLPEESMEDIFKTIELNQSIKTTYPWCSIVQPYPGTRIAEYMKEKGIDLLPDFSYSYFTKTIINDPHKMKIISNAQKLFAFFVKSNVKYNFFTSLVEKPPVKMDILYPAMFYWYYGQDIRKRYGLSWFSLFRYWLYSKRV